MSYKFIPLSPTEFTVKDHHIYKDGNGQWVSNPPVEDTRLQKAVNNYISAIDNG
ncbi:hypothetical protein [Tenacibaculum mesophilum]|uniref:hypothetical protein n=1 Tax=Tenacibaculum mesophilum TaxID=104268 RepID=UPI000A8F859B|nr:hypothetical protein [Tenacibaculum mesophilum]